MALRALVRIGEGQLSCVPLCDQRGAVGLTRRPLRGPRLRGPTLHLLLQAQGVLLSLASRRRDRLLIGARELALELRDRAVPLRQPRLARGVPLLQRSDLHAEELLVLQQEAHARLRVGSHLLRPLRLAASRRQLRSRLLLGRSRRLQPLRRHEQLRPRATLWRGRGVFELAAQLAALATRLLCLRRALLTPRVRLAQPRRQSLASCHLHLQLRARRTHR